MPAEAQEEELKAAEESPEPEEKAAETERVEKILALSLVLLLEESRELPSVFSQGTG